MVSVEQLIGELLLRHNCVIIPSFGGFVAKQTSATIDYRNGLISPPKKSLLFNRQLINNDGLLVAELAVKNAIHYNEATTTVASLVQGWNEQLRKGERITIDKVGFLFFDQEKNICFEQDRFFNLLLESYGLGKVHFLTESDVQLVQKTTIEKALVDTESRATEPAIVFNTESIQINQVEAQPTIIPHPALKSKTNVWKYVAAACMLPIAFYSFWLPMRTNVLESGVLSINDFNPFYKSADGDYVQKPLNNLVKFSKAKTLEELVSELPDDVAVYSYQYDEDLYIPVRIPSKGTNTTEPVQAPISEDATANFEYIVGCFSSEENATNLVNALKNQGLNAHLVDVVNGLHRISAGSATNESNLQAVIEKATSAGQQGWILKK